jgi:hypothetical protein
MRDRENRVLGGCEKVVSVVRSMRAKDMSSKEIAELIGESFDYIEEISELLDSNPNFSNEEIAELLD